MNEPPLPRGGPPAIDRSATPQERAQRADRIKRGLKSYFTGFFIGCVMLAVIMTVKQCLVREQQEQMKQDAPTQVPADAATGATGATGTGGETPVTPTPPPSE